MAVQAYNQSKEEQTKGHTGIAAFFSPENAARLNSIMYPKTVSAGSNLYWDGDPADYVYYIRKGQIKLTKTTDDGNKITLYMHHAGDLFGQIDPFQ